MKRRVLSGGAIACSAVVISGWTQPSTPEQGIDDCQNKLAEAIPSWVPEQITRWTQGSCQLVGMVPTITGVPEFLKFDFLWGNGRTAVLPDEMEAVYGDLLKKAQDAASSNRLADAITNVIGIPKNSRHYDIAQQLQEDWSQELLQRAANHYQQAQTTVALSMLNAIPPTSERFERANELQRLWNQEAALFNQAKAAKNAGDWKGVIDTLKSLDGSMLYHSPPAQELLQQAMNKLFEADETWVQFASSKSVSEVAVNSGGMRSLSFTNTLASLPVEATPKRSSLPIAIDQAMKWAQPPMPSVEPKSNRRKVTSTNSSTSSTSLFPKPSVTPPESAPVPQKTSVSTPVKL